MPGPRGNRGKNDREGSSACRCSIVPPVSSSGNEERWWHSILVLPADQQWRRAQAPAQNAQDKASQGHWPGVGEETEDRQYGADRWRHGRVRWATGLGKDGGSPVVAGNGDSASSRGDGPAPSWEEMP